VEVRSELGAAAVALLAGGGSPAVLGGGGQVWGHQEDIVKVVVCSDFRMWGRRVELHGELELGQQWRRRQAVCAATRARAEALYRPGREGGRSGRAMQCLGECHPAAVARKGFDGERRRHWGVVAHGGRRGSHPSGPGRVANARASSGDGKGANPGVGSAETRADCRPRALAVYGAMRESGRGEIELGLFL
jgi:hypothetical protein